LFIKSYNLKNHQEFYSTKQSVAKSNFSFEHKTLKFVLDFELKILRGNFFERPS